MSKMVDNKVCYALPDDICSGMSATEFRRKYFRKYKELFFEFVEGRGRKKHLEKMELYLSIILLTLEGDFRFISDGIEGTESVLSILTNLSLKDPLKYFNFVVTCLSSKFEVLKYLVTFHSPSLMYNTVGSGINPDKMIQMAIRCGVLETLFYSLIEFPSPIFRFYVGKKQNEIMKKSRTHIPRHHAYRSEQREHALSRAVCLDCHQYAFHGILKRNFARKRLLKVKSSHLRKIVIKMCERFLILKEHLLPKGVGLESRHFETFRKKRETAGFLVLEFSLGSDNGMPKTNAKIILTRFVDFLKKKKSLGLLMKETTYFKDVFFSILTNALSNFYVISREDSSKLRDFEDIVESSSLSTTLLKHLVRDKGKSSIQVHLKMVTLLHQIFVFSNPEKERFKAQNDASEVLAHLMIYYHYIPKIKSKEVERSLLFRIMSIRAILGDFFEGLTHTPESTLSLTRVQNITIIGRSENHAGEVQGVARKVEERISQLLKDRNMDCNFGGAFSSALESVPENGTVPIALGLGRSAFNLDSNTSTSKTATTIPESNFKELGKTVGRTGNHMFRSHIKYISECSKCGKRGKMRRCGVCKVGLYCSVECQKKDWKRHKRECKELVKELGVCSSLCSVCKKSTRLKCTRCKNKFYCCRECQKSDWKKHKVYCKI